MNVSPHSRLFVILLTTTALLLFIKYQTNTSSSNRAEDQYTNQLQEFKSNIRTPAYPSLQNLELSSKTQQTVLVFSSEAAHSSASKISTPSPTYTSISASSHHTNTIQYSLYTPSLEPATKAGSRNDLEHKKVGRYQVNTVEKLPNSINKTVGNGIIDRSKLDEIWSALDDPLFVKDIEEEMSARRGAVSAHCDKLETHGYSVKHVPTQFINFREYKVGHCPVYKAGSSNWKDYLSKLVGLDTSECGHIAKKGVFETCLHNHFLKYAKYPYPIKKENLLNFMIVRHPYERLVSAYRDKVERADKPQFYHIVGRRAKEKYRPLPPHLSDKKQALLKQSDKVVKSHRTLPLDPENPYENPLGPTFVEFSRSVLDDGTSDPHWAIYERYCAPCKMKYDVIGKFETLDRDNLYILKTLGLEQAGWPGHTNPTGRGGTGNRTWAEYFRTLPRDLLDKYRDMYLVDCQMFGYDCDVSQFYQTESEFS